MKRKNALFLLIDGLRYDVLSELEAARAVVPNLARLAERGFVRRAVANAQGTQFVMPALFSLTYPLDYGGYNNGIRDRPKSFVEVLGQAGYNTYLMASCNMLTPASGYDRGFDEVHTAADYRHILEYRIDKTLRYELELWQNGERSEAETIALIQREFDLLLADVSATVDNAQKSIWSRRLRRINEGVAHSCPAERALLAREPLAVMNKLISIPPILYWRFLGRRKANPIALLWRRAIEAIRWRSRRYLNPTWFPTLLLTHYQVLAGEVFSGVRRFLAGAREPWYLHFHVMDLHDCYSLSRPLNLIYRLRFLPRWVRARRAGHSKRRLVYDLALMDIDHHVGKLLDALEETGKLDDTVIVVTGDHGSHFAGSPRAKFTVANRTHFEDLEVPLLLVGDSRRPTDQGLTDTMGCSATLLDALGIAPHPSFKGRSVFGSGRPAVIAETAGSGNADLERRDLYFTVTTASHKLMTVLRGSRLEVLELYDLTEDPLELRNLADDPAHRPAIETLIGHLYQERGELLAWRGAPAAGAGATRGQVTAS